jgi:hypothetical protein
MKILRILSIAGITFSLAFGSATALASQTYIVTTELNVNPPAGSLSLAQALSKVQNGDRIAFNIAGNGPHLLLTPPDGYPLITANNLTIDGYSQPGSVPNSNPILAANNAKISIVLDSRNGNVTLLDFAGDSPNDDTGYGDSEAAVLGILTATNVTIRGLDILAPPLLPGASPSGDDVDVYGISLAKNAQAQISGCWIGIGTDGKTIAGPAIGISGFRYRVKDDTGAVLDSILINNVVVGVPRGSTNAPADFNVIAGIPGIPIEIEGNNTRISGNFLNVYPSGVQDFDPPLFDSADFSGTFEGNIEIGRGGNNTLIGVDGDGVNDENERNVFSGVLPPSQGGYDHNIEFYGQSPGTNIVIAGNYFGIGVDGTTRFTNGVPVLNAPSGSTQYRFGSDFNGVSDALEGNVAYNNWPTDLFPTTGSDPFFDELSIGSIVSARGNTFVNNFPFPVSPTKVASGSPFLEGYYAQALADSTQGVVPIIATNSTSSRLIGTVPLPNSDFPVVMIDLYTVDPEGLAYGQTANEPLLPHGYVQGKKYLGSFVDNSAADANKAPGAFDFDISSVGASGKITITANYSKSPAGTSNAITLTSPFADPVDVGAATGGSGATLSIAVASATTFRLTWTGGSGPFQVQHKASLSDPQWSSVTTTADSTAIVQNDSKAGFFRVMNHAP